MDAPHGLPVAPALHRRRPLLGQVVLRQPLERADQLAVDQPRREGVELAGDGGHGGLVEQPEALPDLALQDEAAGLGHPADGGGGRVARRADLDGPPGPAPGAREVAREQPLVAPHHRQPGVDRRLLVARQAAQEALRALCPPPDGRHERGVEEQVQGDPDGRPGGREPVARAHALRVGPLPRGDRHVEAAHGVPRLGEQGQVRPTQGRAGVRLGEQVVRALPLAPPRRRAPGPRA